MKFFNNVVMRLLLWFSLSSGKLERKPYTNTFKDSGDPWANYSASAGPCSECDLIKGDKSQTMMEFQIPSFSDFDHL